MALSETCSAFRIQMVPCHLGFINICKYLQLKCYEGNGTSVQKLKVELLLASPMCNISASLERSALPTCVIMAELQCSNAQTSKSGVPLLKFYDLGQFVLFFSTRK